MPRTDRRFVLEIDALTRMSGGLQNQGTESERQMELTLAMVWQHSREAYRKAATDMDDVTSELHKTMNTGTITHYKERGSRWRTEPGFLWAELSFAIAYTE
jgi:hypothetical protein